MADEKKISRRSRRQMQNAAERALTTGAASRGLLGRAARSMRDRENELNRKIDEIDRETTR